MIDIGPSGHKEKNETDEAAARREIYEETGLKGLNFDRGFRFDLKYEFDATDDNGEDVHIMKTRRYWCARLPEGYENMSFIIGMNRYLMGSISTDMRTANTTRAMLAPETVNSMPRYTKKNVLTKNTIWFW